ncbi:MAG: 4Fe-4S binding protein, partial [Candidatus Kariarchaeaceae archaeon]
MGFFHFKPGENSFFRRAFLNLYARFEIPYLKLNTMILDHAIPSRLWRFLFTPLIYFNAFIMLRYGQHGKIMTVKEIGELLDKADDVQIAVGSCRCRVASPKKCDCELNTDITIRTGAGIYKRHFSKDYEMISKDKAIELISQLNKKGLIPSIYTFCMFGGAMHEFVICNCCVHACVPIRAQEMVGLHTYDPGDSLARVDKQDCIGCGKCIEICQLKARSLVNNKSRVKPY